ncbi:N-acetyltransferase [Stenotrophomonas pennii]|uniref:GNAT family N-acetyltransferase n=1 Tax=Stenotrophomonas lacuserhaii TaxID=2760084 RepID=UPI0032081279
MTITLRKEHPADAGPIAVLTEAAFRTAPHSSHTEHFIVDALRNADRLTLSLVAEDAGRIVGHVALSAVSLSSGDAGWHGLGPISVDPRRQGQGIGAALVHGALQWLRDRGAAGCVLLGDPGYYTRFGFKPYPQLALADVPAEYFMALPLASGVPQAEVTYDPLFGVTG